MKHMLQIYCKNTNISKDCPTGSSLLEIYPLFDLQMPYQVVSAKVNNRSEGLNFRVFNNKDVEYLDVRDPSGMRTYVRSLCFVLYKAVNELFPHSKLLFEHPVSKGYFCDLRLGRPIEEADVKAIKKRMEEIVAAYPTLKILVMSGLQDQHSIVRVLQMGAAGFIPKSLDANLLTSAIGFVLNGGVYIPVKLLNQAQKTGLLTAREPTGEVGSVHLTQRQREVLELLAKGAPIKRICKELDLSEGTVKTHVTAIYRAFGATNRTEALLEARRHGFDVGI